MTARYDVAVIGLGIMGSAAACHLARRGLRVVALERHWPGHVLGSSHGESRLLRGAHVEHPDYVPLALRAHELWRELETAAGRQLLVACGALVVGPPEGALVRSTRELVGAPGLELHPLEGEALARRAPGLVLNPGDVGLYEPAAGLLLPSACWEAHLQLAVRHGAELRFGAPASLADTGWRGRGDPVVIDVGDARVEAERVVVAAGPWTSRVLPPGALPVLRVERVTTFTFMPRDERAFAAPEYPVVLWERPGRPLGIFPRVPGARGVKVAYHGGEPVSDPDTVDRRVARAEQAAVRAEVEAAVPSLAGRLVAAGACLYTHTADGRMALGPVGDGRVFIISACSGHGYKFAPVIGEVVADLLTRGETRHPIGSIRLNRPSLRL